MKLTLKILLITFWLVLACSLAMAAQVTGKTSLDDDHPVAGVRVAAYPATVLDFEGDPPFRSQPSNDQGQFNLNLPPGEYYLLAKGAKLFCFYGRNPVSIPPQGLDSINLLMTPQQLPGPEPGKDLGSPIQGRITHHGEPVAGATVMVYPDLSSQLKGMGLAASLPTDPSGLFELQLPPGNYYLVVRLRNSGALAGPLKAGDLFGYYAGNPLVLKPQQVARVEIPVIEVPENISRHATSMFGSTRISDRIVDSRGEPVSGLVAMLYQDSSMLNRPLYVSAKTGGDGRFLLSFPQGGTYFLAARSELGGTPAPGELYGRYQGAGGEGLKIETGQSAEQIEIVVDEVF